MKKILMMLMLLVSTNVLAVDWVKVSESADHSYTFYVDPQSIRRDGNKVRVWVLTDYKSVKVSGNKTYLSSVARDEYDCFEDTQRNIDIHAYQEKMGTGGIVVSVQNRTEPAISLPPGSMGAETLKIVCATK